MLNLQAWHIVLTAVVLLFLGAFVGGRIAIVKDLVQAGQDSHHDTTALLDEAAQAVADRPSAEWAGQITHFLKALDSKSGRDEYTETLQAVRDAISARLAQDKW